MSACCTDTNRPANSSNNTNIPDNFSLVLVDKTTGGVNEAFGKKSGKLQREPARGRDNLSNLSAVESNGRNAPAANNSLQ